MIFVTGDCHGNFKRFEPQIFIEQEEMSKEDYVIICGDFGGIWAQDDDDPLENLNMLFLEDRNFTILFIDGNHENFDRLDTYPVEEWHGGKVHKIRNNVIHLMRGQVYKIDGKKIFTFGGASSHDIEGGILEFNDPDFKEKSEIIKKNNQHYRINHYSWWERELASEEEMNEGRKNLAQNNFNVDYIITHCCSSSTQAYFSNGGFKPDRENRYLEEIKQMTRYKKWFFGHYHNNRNINKKEIMLYEQIIRIS